MHKTDTQKIIDRQSKITIKDKIGEFEKFNLNSFNEENTLSSKPIYAGFCILELSK